MVCKRKYDEEWPFFFVYLSLNCKWVEKMKSMCGDDDGDVFGSQEGGVEMMNMS